MSDPKQDRNAPQWTSSQGGDNYMIHVDGVNRIQLEGQRVVAQTRDDRQPSRRVDVSVPHTPYEKWIDLEGNVRNIPMKTTRVMERRRNGSGMQSVDQGNYAAEISQHLLSCGYMRYDAPPTGETMAVWEARRETEIATRRNEHNAEAMAEQKKWLDKVEHEKHSIQQALTSALESFSDGVKQRTDRAERKKKLDGE